MSNVGSGKVTLGGLRAWFVWSCAALFYFYQFILRVSPNVMTDELLEAFSIDATSLGFITAFYYYSYAAMQLPLGVMMDRFGARRLLASAGLICAFGSWCFAISSDMSLASVGRFLIGMGSACGFLGCLKLATVWFPPRRLGLVTGFTMMLGVIGAASGGAPLEHIITLFGWRETMKGLAIVGIILAALIYLIVRDTPPHQQKPRYKREASPPGLFAGLFQVMVSPQAWMIALYGMLMYVPLAVIGDLWGVTFVQKYYDIDEKIAATVVATMFFGIAVGAPIFAMFSDRVAKRRLPQLLGAGMGALIYLAILYVPNIPLPVMYVLFFLAGFSFTSQCLCFTSVCEIMPLNASGIAVGFTNMVVMLSGVVFHPLVGSLLDMHWDGTMSGDVPAYTYENFQFAFICIPISLLAAIVLTRMIRETYPGTRTTFS